MRFRTFAVAAALMLAAVAPARAAEAAPDTAVAAAAATRPSRVVMTWMPPYSRADSWARLRMTYGGYGPGNALTHLGLQFWRPTAAGSVVKVSQYGTISDPVIKAYVDWAHSKGIKVMLTIYNGDTGRGVYGWDWPTAYSAMANNRARFVANLVKEMQRLNLDGVDIDLEGPQHESTAAEKAAYIAFMRDLGVAVRAKGKLVQVDTFSWIYNTPNWDFWADMFPHVDIIASMGYEEIGRGLADWQGYEGQRAKAGSAANQYKLIMGLPSSFDTWKGFSSVDQVKWFVPSSIRVGVGVWDARVLAPSWRDRAIWTWLRKIKDQNPK